MKKLILALTLIGCAAPVFAASGTSSMPIQDKPAAFVHLDIAQILRNTDNNHECGVQPEELKYLDHQGRVHQLDYEASGLDCANDS